jgi:hypothetical protein
VRNAWTEPGSARPGVPGRVRPPGVARSPSREGAGTLPGFPCLIVLVVFGAAAPAQAYDFSVDVRTIGQGYQVRGFAPDGSNELLSRRRLTQYLDLNVYDIAPDAWHGDDGGRNIFYFDSSFRFDADFGGYLLGAPTGQNAIAELKQDEIDILFAYLGGRNVGGHLDFQIGRQIHFDLIDFYAFDGADLLYHATRLFGVEAFAGTEVRGAMPFASPIYELDGTSAGSRDPATRPAQNSEIAPLAGAALVAGAPTGAWSARLSFREIWSATADRLPGEPDSGINEEVVSLTAMASWRNRVFLSGGIRYNFLFDELDDEQLALRFKLTQRQWLTLEHDFLAPTFDGDSIWNVFSTGAYRDLRASYEIGLPGGVKAYARGFARFFLATPDEMSGAYAGQESGAGDDRFAAGGSVGAAWRNARGMFRADGYWDGGYGGRKIGVDATTRVKVRPAIELEGRLTGYGWRNDLPSATPSGVVFGAQAGGRIQLGRGTRAHLLLEDNVGTYYESQFRGLAMLELDTGP